MAETQSDFNLAGVASALQKRWKILGVFIVISVVTSAVALLFIPKKYKATTVIIPANPLLTDKGHYFNPNIDQLYSNFGTGDDVDRLLGMTALDTTYKLLADSFDLVGDYYPGKSITPLIRHNATTDLKEDIKVQKTELNQLKISVWNKDAAKAAEIANTMVALVNARLSGIAKIQTQKTITQLGQKIDSINSAVAKSKPTDLGAANVNETGTMPSVKQGELSAYEKLAGELQMANSNPMPSLYVVEYASPSPKADKPAIMLTLLASFIASLFFGMLFILIFDKRKPE